MIARKVAEVLLDQVADLNAAGEQEPATTLFRLVEPLLIEEAPVQPARWTLTATGHAIAPGDEVTAG